MKQYGKVWIPIRNSYCFLSVYSLQMTPNLFYGQMSGEHIFQFVVFFYGFHLYRRIIKDTYICIMISIALCLHVYISSLSIDLNLIDRCVHIKCIAAFVKINRGKKTHTHTPVRASLHQKASPKHWH